MVSQILSRPTCATHGPISVLRGFWFQSELDGPGAMIRRPSLLFAPLVELLGVPDGLAWPEPILRVDVLPVPAAPEAHAAARARGARDPVNERLGELAAHGVGNGR
eukprot:3000868-Pyramimonas_sp.AAC.1